MRNVTVLGQVRVLAVDLVENSLFAGRLCVTNHQQGCVRFCYVPPGSRTPLRIHCQPDEAIRRAQEVSQALTPLLELSVAARVAPRFRSTAYGDPDYARLDDTCPVEIDGGADDAAEMGALHDEFLPQRAALLRARLAEFVPAGCDADIIFET